MSDLELERAAMGPGRWIELCTSLKKKQRINDFNKMPHSRTRIIKDSVNSIFIVPGGRYLVVACVNLSVWDLGCFSTVECKLVASVGLEDNLWCNGVQATPVGKGLVILSSNK